jgi:ubiquinone biosynthesis protein Coq4
MHPSTREKQVLRYVAQDSSLTLREGLVEYYAANPGLIDPAEASTPEMQAYFGNHDASHVVFGTTTDIGDETLNDIWTFFAMDVGFRDYVVALASADEAKLILKKTPPLALLKALVRLLWLTPVLASRSYRMTQKWHWRGWQDHLDRPLREIRRELGLRVL